jgi:tetratricopeptide (TPR) repeat protein
VAPRRLTLLALWAIAGSAALAQEQKPQEPPEEDETLIQKEYSFNPIQAEKEVQIGNFYFKKGSYRAAAGRFREATKWNANYAEAYLRLGEACEKLKDPGGARQAYEKFLKLAPDSKEAPRVRKFLTGKG